MKNRILIIGNNEFSREYIDNEICKINKKKYISALYYKYEVHNLSNDSLDSAKAYKLAKAFIEKNKYQACIISIGKEDYRNNTIELFEENLQNILNMLKSYRIVPILLEVSDSDIDLEEINRIIRKYKKELNLQYGIYDGLIFYNPNIQFC